MNAKYSDEGASLFACELILTTKVRAQNEKIRKKLFER